MISVRHYILYEEMARSKLHHLRGWSFLSPDTHLEVFFLKHVFFQTPYFFPENFRPLKFFLKNVRPLKFSILATALEYCQISHLDFSTLGWSLRLYTLYYRDQVTSQVWEKITKRHIRRGLTHFSDFLGAGGIRYSGGGGKSNENFKWSFTLKSGIDLKILKKLQPGQHYSRPRLFNFLIIGERSKNSTNISF